MLLYKISQYNAKQIWKQLAPSHYSHEHIIPMHFLPQQPKLLDFCAGQAQLPQPGTVWQVRGSYIGFKNI